MIDLPGVYSLAVIPGTDAIDERIGRDYILSGEPDVIVNIVDATNLERHLYLTAQLIEMQVPMVVALNMTDVAQQMGIEVDTWWPWPSAWAVRWCPWSPPRAKARELS